MKYYSFYLLHRQAQALALFHALKINNKCGLLVIQLNSSKIGLNLRLTVPWSSNHFLKISLNSKVMKSRKMYLVLITVGWLQEYQLTQQQASVAFAWSTTNQINDFHFRKPWLVILVEQDSSWSDLNRSQRKFLEARSARK